MCVAIIKPPSADFPKELFEAAWKKNPHGGGYMYASAGKVVVRKGFMTLPEMMRDYEEHKPYFGDSPVVLHFRIKTHGPIAPDQTHPHVISDRLAFVHNGVINIQIPEGSSNSDTMEFRDRVLSRLPEGFVKDPVLMELIRGYVDTSRLVFLDADKNVVIVNEQSGHVDPAGRWHSNEGALAAVDPQYQRDDFYEIIDSRFDPEIGRWKGLSKKTKKSILRAGKKAGKRVCKYCQAKLDYHDEDDVCGQCLPTCKTCGGKMPDALAQAGSEICERCMTDDEREEVNELLVEGSVDVQYRDPKEAAEEMSELVCELDPEWLDTSHDMSPDDFYEFTSAAKDGFVEFTAWFRDHVTDPTTYAILRQKLMNSAQHKVLFESGRERAAGYGEDAWEMTERNPPRQNSETGKIFLVS